mmetsp:Transcript_99319/g.121535  ORF Transcript_99319/g.121535 Transcript_99319/m.121535 type:complete len:283 (+) Transcript_99319:53-901(+)
MLRRGSNKISSLFNNNKRTLFDYVRFANEYDAGKSLAQIKQDKADEDAERQSDQFSWDWMSWYERNDPDGYARAKDQRSRYGKFEQYCGKQALLSSATDIDWNKYRNKIKDPAFVDELEIEYYLDKNTTESIKSMSTLDEWNESSVSSFKQDIESNGDLLWEPMTSKEKEMNERQIMESERKDEDTKHLISELEKDFEQADHERMLFGNDTMSMKLSEHPQYAENIEDLMVARQSYNDYVMMPYHINYLKRERLAQIQDENRRKLFLERFELASKIHNGEDH